MAEEKQEHSKYSYSAEQKDHLQMQQIQQSRSQQMLQYKLSCPVTAHIEVEPELSNLSSSDMTVAAIQI